MKSNEAKLFLNARIQETTYMIRDHSGTLNYCCGIREGGFGHFTNMVDSALLDIDSNNIVVTTLLIEYFILKTLLNVLKDTRTAAIVYTDRIRKNKSDLYTFIVDFFNMHFNTMYPGINPKTRNKLTMWVITKEDLETVLKQYNKIV